uniref:Uncharacterized protein n=1 Tax=Oryza glumipatula TaxID=40148 RepID=A0A0E0AW75_9ORYZ
MVMKIDDTPIVSITGSCRRDLDHDLS